MFGSRYSPPNQSYQDLNMINELSDIKNRLRMTEEQMSRERETFSATKIQVIHYVFRFVFIFVADFFSQN